MARLLVVEDDRVMARGLSAALRALGFSIDVAHDGAGAIEMLRDGGFGLVTLDLGLPDESGFDVLKRMRRAGDKTPVIILTARDAIEDRITGLDLGADDYVFKPFEVSELAARIRALLRRAQGEASPEIHVGSLCFDGVHGEARVGERRLELRPREWVLLERLVARPGKVVSKDRLTSEIFGFDEPVAPNAVELYVARLRQKLGPDGPRIRTVRGLGYVLEGDAAG